ncbi:4a-hydroxytetrahydrobiopterin dehydratase [Salininema proteolyticum]|uniref:Putative pterin-4-alpha-carbinolamine dehydratase n=1 Tax=Salininema proteolyticum TaxID=1607685 RepID=A0ABV8TTY0_9ACTN
MASEVLTEDRLKEALAGLPEWRVEDGQLRRDVEAPSFPEAIALVVKVAEKAEEANHHPDIDIRWRTVHFALVTHDSGGLTEKDTSMAASIDALARF